MNSKIKIGIIICDRYRRCAGGKCLRAMRNREGAFSLYADTEIELAGYTTCDGCPGGNIEYAGEEMVKNGAEVIHFATGMVVGYPPCPFIDTFKSFIENRFKVKVVVGTHPIPTKYYEMHNSMSTLHNATWNQRYNLITADEIMRLKYD